MARHSWRTLPNRSTAALSQCIHCNAKRWQVRDTSNGAEKFLYSRDGIAWVTVIYPCTRATLPEQGDIGE